jgi:hypothetical protein
MIRSINEKYELDGHVARTERGNVHKKIWGESLSEKEHLEDRNIDGRTILSWIFRKRVRGEDWINLAQYRDRRRAIVNTIINIPVA